MLEDVLRRLIAGSKNMDSAVTHQVYLDALLEDGLRGVETSLNRLREEVSGRTQIANDKLAAVTARLKNIGANGK